MSSSPSLHTGLLLATFSSLGQSHVPLHGGAEGMNIVHALGELGENELLYLISVDLPTALNLVLPSQAT